MKKYIIAWDLGATKCTAGLVELDPSTEALHCQNTATIKLKEADSLEDLIQQLESLLHCKMAEADAICIGAAGFYDGETLLLENGYPFAMPFAQIARHQKWPNFAVIHDYAPIVCATFTNYMTHPQHVKRLNDAIVSPHARRIAFGLGTGLGMKDGVLFPNGDFWLGQNEVGHIGIPTPPHMETSARKRHEALMQFLRDTHAIRGNVTFESVLTGQGTVNLYDFFYQHEGKLSPEEIGEKMRAGKTPELMETLAYYIGLFIGTVQLVFLPEGGIWITGGVSMKHIEVFDLPALWEGIHASPAYLTQRERYPLGVLMHPEHALIGCGYYAGKRLV